VKTVFYIYSVQSLLIGLSYLGETNRQLGSQASKQTGGRTHTNGQ